MKVISSRPSRNAVEDSPHVNSGLDRRKFRYSAKKSMGERAEACGSEGEDAEHVGELEQDRHSFTSRLRPADCYSATLLLTTDATDATTVLLWLLCCYDAMVYGTTVLLVAY